MEPNMQKKRTMTYDTAILHKAADKDPFTGALSIPIYPASTYHQQNILARPDFEYSRAGNPTRKALEEVLAALEKAQYAYAFASGMAAISGAIMACVKSGDHIIAARDIYGGTHRFLTGFLNRFNVTCSFADTTDIKAVAKAVRPATKVLFLETPSNPLLKVTDVAACVALAKKHSLITMIDNTFLSPYFFKPLDLGVDISIHSATKFLGGHSDLIAGAVMCRSKALADTICSVQISCGSILSPENSWLLLRGIKTLSARMNVQQQSAQVIAEWLAQQPWVSDVFYPGLAGHPGHTIMKEQAEGFGAVLSFRTDTVKRAHKLMKHVKLLAVAVSLGGVESILSYPARMSHASIPRKEREALGITDTLLRFSVGLESPQDLIDDLGQAVNA